MTSNRTFLMNGEPDISMLRRQGLVGFIQKPFRAAALRHVITNAVDADDS